METRTPLHRFRWLTVILLLSVWSLALSVPTLRAEGESEWQEMSLAPVVPGSPLALPPGIDSSSAANLATAITMDANLQQQRLELQLVQPPVDTAQVPANTGAEFGRLSGMPLSDAALASEANGTQQSQLAALNGIESNPQAQGGVCTGLLQNPSFTGSASPWTALVQTVSLTNNEGSPQPPSITMVEDGDGYYAQNGTDLDAIYQIFTYPANGRSAELDFRLAYLSSTVSNPPNDSVYAELYLVNPDNSLGQYVDGYRIPTTYDNSWYRHKYPISSDKISKLRNQRVAFVISTATNGYQPYQRIYVDEAQVNACTSVISGRVTSGATAPSNGLVFLYYTSPQGQVGLLDFTETTNGQYAFYGYRGLLRGESFQVWFFNNAWFDEDGARPDLVSYWAGPTITADQYPYDYQVQSYSVPSFDISNIELLEPDHYARANLGGGNQVAFSWKTRHTPDKYYFFCMVDFETLDELCSNAITPIANSKVQGGTLNLQTLQSVPEFNFRFDRPYGWYIIAADKQYDGRSFANLGASYYLHAIIFTNAEAAEPPDIEREPDNPPSSDPNQADWLIMVYMAGDNDLGDPNRYPDPTNNLQGQYAALRKLAKDHPGLRIVVLRDFPGHEQNAQYCYLSASAPRCTNAPGNSDNSASPAMLSGFIQQASSQFPARQRMLIISGHGDSVSGVARDEQSGASEQIESLSPAELSQALADAGLAMRKLDLIYFDTCLMGTIETAFLVSPYARYMVAAANPVWILNSYERILDAADASRSSADPARALATQLIAIYADKVSRSLPIGLYVSLAAYDLQRMPQITTKLSALAERLTTVLEEESKNNTNTVRAALKNVRASVQLYDSSAAASQIKHWKLGEEDAYVDLHHLLSLLSAQSFPDSQVRTAAAQLQQTLGTAGQTGSFVFARVQRSGSVPAEYGGGTQQLQHASGLAIVFPNGSQNESQPATTNLYLNGDGFDSFFEATRWDAFIRQYDRSVVQAGPGGSTVFKNGPYRFSTGGSGSAGRGFVTPQLLPLAGGATAAGSIVFVPLARR